VHIFFHFLKTVKKSSSSYMNIRRMNGAKVSKCVIVVGKHFCKVLYCVSAKHCEINSVHDVFRPGGSVAMRQNSRATRHCRIN
jgi:hypothetical protein